MSNSDFNFGHGEKSEQQFSFDFSEERAHARATDPKTSHAAAASVANIRQSQTHVLDILRAFGPLSDEQLIERYRLESMPPQSDSGIRTRRSELVVRGLVADSGRRDVTAAGRETILWMSV